MRPVLVWANRDAEASRIASIRIADGKLPRGMIVILTPPCAVKVSQAAVVVKGYVRWCVQCGYAVRKTRSEAYGPETAMVTPACDWAESTLSNTGTSPAAVPAGMRTLTCKIPATIPGAAPAYSNVASWPPIRTLTGNRGAGRAGPVIAPSEPGGLVWPSPVA